MARKAQNQASQNFGNSQTAFNTGMGVAGTAGANAGNLYSKLSPMYEQEAENPQGYGGADLAGMNTAVQQSVGGSTAAAKGEGMLQAARTRNRGAMASSIGDSIRSGQRTLADKALDIQGKNADLKQRQQQAGLEGLAGLYGENEKQQLGGLGEANQSIGEGNSAINAEANAGNSGWLQNLLSTINALKPGYSQSGGFSVG